MSLHFTYAFVVFIVSKTKRSNRLFYCHSLSYFPRNTKFRSIRTFLSSNCENTDKTMTTDLATNHETEPDERLRRWKIQWVFVNRNSKVKQITCNSIKSILYEATWTEYINTIIVNIRGQIGTWPLKNRAQQAAHEWQRAANALSALQLIGSCFIIRWIHFWNFWNVSSMHIVSNCITIKYGP